MVGSQQLQPGQVDVFLVWFLDWEPLAFGARGSGPSETCG